MASLLLASSIEEIDRFIFASAEAYCVCSVPVVLIAFLT